LKLKGKKTSKLSIILLIRSPSIVVLYPLSDHTKSYNKDKRCDCTSWFEWRDESNRLKNGNNEEVYIGIASELKDEGKW
jgi:hypothetical protein